MPNYISPNATLPLPVNLAHNIDEEEEEEPHPYPNLWNHPNGTFSTVDRASYA